jgi:hypothetical protein
MMNMNEKLQKKAQKTFVSKPEMTAIINAGDYIVIATGSKGVHVPKVDALIAYQRKMAYDNETGEVHNDNKSEPEYLKENSYHAMLTDCISYTTEHKIARKMVTTDMLNRLEAYVLLEDLKYFGADVGYRIADDRVVVTEGGTLDVLGMIMKQEVE